MTPRSSSAPAAAAVRETQRQGEEEVAVLEPAAGVQAGQMDVQPERGKRHARAEDVLDQVGRVGADGDEFPVGHVDDAHQAERDRQPDGDDQEHGTERQAAEQGAEKVDPAQVRLDGPDRLARRGRHRGLVGGGAPPREFLEDVAGRERAHLPQGAGGVGAGGGVVVLQPQQRDGHRERALDGGVGLHPGAGLERGELGAVARQADGVHGPPALDRVGVGDRGEVQHRAHHQAEFRVGVRGLHVRLGEADGLAGGDRGVGSPSPRASRSGRPRRRRRHRPWLRRA